MTLYQLSPQAVLGLVIVFMAAEPEDLIGLSSVAGLPLVVSSSRVNGQW